MLHGAYLCHGLYQPGPRVALPHEKVRYNSSMQSATNEKDAARRASRQMWTAALVICLSFVLVLVLVAIAMYAGHIRIF
jgi:hypothetical protein